jgi:hypothetical protein
MLAQAGLVFVFLDFNLFEIFGLENLSAIETFNVLDTFSAGDHLGTDVVTGGLHKQQLDEVYSTQERCHVKPLCAIPGTSGTDRIPPRTALQF